ncbi:MAG: hypothetical protein PVJ02_06505 [Gemmatimonadota bacterium]|jgi:hypothetical protein
MDEWVGHAHDDLVRFRPEAGLEKVRAWVTDIQVHLSPAERQCSTLGRPSPVVFT